MQGRGCWGEAQRGRGVLPFWDAAAAVEFISRLFVLCEPLDGQFRVQRHSSHPPSAHEETICFVLLLLRLLIVVFRGKITCVFAREV